MKGTRRKTLSLYFTGIYLEDNVLENSSGSSCTLTPVVLSSKSAIGGSSPSFPSDRPDLRVTSWVTSRRNTLFATFGGNGYVLEGRGIVLVVAPGSHRDPSRYDRGL